MKFNDILYKFRAESFTQKDKGTQFERLMQSWLLSDPRYSILTDVWLWEDFPSKADLGGKDTGIDLVARTDSSDYGAIQCKCYKEIKKDFDDTQESAIDLAVPATTNPKSIAKQLKVYRDHNGLTIIFSTYQSIEAIKAAQDETLKETGGSYGKFDLIVCDDDYGTLYCNPRPQIPNHKQSAESITTPLTFSTFCSPSLTSPYKLLTSLIHFPN